MNLFKKLFSNKKDNHSSPIEKKIDSVQIGKQIWMAKNLNVDKFQNGDMIPCIESSEQWIKAHKDGAPACCFYENNIENGKIYGKLYNWYALTDSRILVPKGWHIPSDAEWTELINYLGGENVAGGKLKDVGSLYWIPPNTGATNESGFSALPGGMRDGFQGDFEDINGRAYFWSTTENDSTAWYRSLSLIDKSVDHFYLVKSAGFSIRCVKD